jgi:hypothetical protein
MKNMALFSILLAVATIFMVVLLFLLVVVPLFKRKE